MESFDFGGIPIAYTHEGSGGPPVVLLHNAGASHAIWASQLAVLARQYDVYALDLFGYGQSGKPRGGYTLDRYTAMAQAFLTHRGLPSAVFVGNCLGSAISLNLARQHPATVAALVLINPLTKQTARAGSLGPLAWLTGQLPGPAARLLLGSLNPPSWLAREIVRYWFASSAAFQASPQVRGLRAGWTSAATARALTGLAGDLNSFAILDNWPGSAVLPPVCTIWGMENKVLSAAAGLILNRQLRPDRQEWLADCGHVPMLEQPGTVTAVIGEFLAQHLRAAEVPA